MSGLGLERDDDAAAAAAAAANGGVRKSALVELLEVRRFCFALRFFVNRSDVLCFAKLEKIQSMGAVSNHGAFIPRAF